MCGLTKYGMRRRTLREHRGEMRVLWDLIETENLNCTTEDLVIQELGMTSHDLYFASSLDVPSDDDSDPEEELREALAGERALVEAVGNIQDLQHLHGELKRSKAKIMSREAQVRSLRTSLDHAIDKRPRETLDQTKCHSRNAGQGTSPGQPSRKRTVDGETLGS